MRGGLNQYLSKSLLRSLSCYHHAGELGYEVSQSNAAYLLSRKVRWEDKRIIESSDGTNAVVIPLINGTGGGGGGSNSCNSSFTCSSSSCCSISSISSISTVDRRLLKEKLLFRQSELAVRHGNKESLLDLGHCYLKGSCGVTKDIKQAERWYSRASHYGNGLASLYLGVMHHFGIGGLPINVDRASRYYDKALLSPSLEVQMHMIGRGLKYMLGIKSYSILRPISYSMDYVVRRLWGDHL